ncbi:MAG: general secretion pathway protein GspK [Methyloprofundus sp.]|nr:general secretion pathway protein GspK [Methyloprofundus sp.]
MKTDKGLALIVVLWVITLLTIMASSFSLTIQRESAITSGLKERAEAEALAEAGIHYAALMLFSSDEELRWKAFGSLYEIEFAGKKIRVQIADESGKLNINLATKDQLQQLISSVILDEALTDNLSDAIMDWRDANELRLLNGAEQQQYQDEGLDYEPRNAEFQSIEELQMVLGMTTQIYQKLEGMLSVYTNTKEINPSTATRDVLLTLPDASEELVDDYLQQRVENERNGEPIVNPVWFKGSSKNSNVYMIISEAKIDKNITKKLMVVIKKSNDKSEAFSLLKWSANYQGSSLFLASNDARVVN